MNAQEKLQNQLSEYIEKTLELRYSIQVPSYDTDFIEVHRVMVKAQELLSSIEGYLSRAIRAKAASDRKIFVARMAYQEAWDKAIIKVNSRPTLSDYASAKEKAAEANLATLDYARVLRKEEELQSFAAEAVDVIRLHYYGLDKVRQDLRKRLDLESNSAYS